MTAQDRLSTRTGASSTPTMQGQCPRINLFNPHLAAVQIVAQEMARIHAVRSEVLATTLGFLNGTNDDPSPGQAPAPAAAPSATTVAAQQPPRVERPVHVIGEGLSWQTARDRLIALRRSGEYFTSLRDLATRIGCSEGLIRKAIKSDTGLRAWAAGAKRTRRTAPAATSLDHAIRRVPQGREAAPDVDIADSDAPADDDAVLQRLIEAASPSERARLHAMPTDRLRSLLRLVGEQHADHDRAPLRKRA
jgi:hypothetical protein